MRRVIYIPIIACLLSLFSAAHAAEEGSRIPIIVSAEADAGTHYIGDKIEYSIKVIAEKGVEVELPYFEDEIGGIPIKDFSSKEKRGLFGKKTLVHVYILTTFEPAEYFIPAALIKYRRGAEGTLDEIRTKEVKIEIKSVLEGEKGVLGIRDIKGPVAIVSVAARAINIIAILAIIVILIFAFSLMRKKRDAAPIPVKPAHEIAYEALERLNRLDLIKEGKVKEYYSGLSNIIRHYLENRFSLRAPEMTTEEFLIEAKDTENLSRDDKILLKDFMLHCDLVKFAKYGPTGNEIDSNSQSAKLLIDQTKEVEKKEANSR